MSQNLTPFEDWEGDNDPISKFAAKLATTLAAKRKLTGPKLVDKIEDLVNYIIDRRMGLGGAVPLIEEVKKEIAQLLEE